MPRAARPIVPEQQTARVLVSDCVRRTRERVEDVAGLPLLRSRGLFGQGVAVAVVDEGIHVESLSTKLRAMPEMARGPFPMLDVDSSRVAPLPEPFARGRRSHGSMCAYDVCLAAPGCTLLDLPTHAPRPVGLKRIHLILAAYDHLNELARKRCFEHIVVVNAWQTLPNDALGGRDPDDPRHPLYAALSELDAAGVDVIFSAPDHHAERIHGPALHPSVLTVTAVNLDGTPFDSSVERLCPRSGKPDIANYQGFAGYELFKNQGDYGTSAAAALTAGQVAALRSDPRTRALTPAALRALFRESGKSGMPLDGVGIADVGLVLERL